MKVYAISDIHIDFEENRVWLENLSRSNYKNDILIVAGDITDKMQLLEEAFELLANCFLKVFYVPGNHDLWVVRDKNIDSFEKFELIRTLARKYKIVMEPTNFGNLSIVPLYGWYDYSFGEPSQELIDTWADYIACKWTYPNDEKSLTEFFTGMNNNNLNISNDVIISFSHFLPRIDIMPIYIPPDRRKVYPVLGSILIEKQIRKINSKIHVYGHSHVNLSAIRNNTTYVNNAFGYPYEFRICAKELKCIYEI